MWENPLVNSFFLNVALICFGFEFCILLYMSVWAPCILKRDIDLDKDMPSVIPVMTIAGLLIFVCTLLAVWPIWGFLTPIYMIILFFGTSFATIFLPNGTLGNLLFWVGVIVAGYISHTMPHDPVW